MNEETADATGESVEVACSSEETALGAALLAGMALGWWSGRDDLAEAWVPALTVEPKRLLDRAGWSEACGRATLLQRTP